ncbi:MAG: GNAT family N-acetyltransferase [Acidobacteria bacterium]|nr:GNAT family N-acetyltransferase [Acidobacteriota bacterium]
MRNGECVRIRPIQPEDEPTMVKFHESLSERTVYQRYLQMLNLSQRTAHERLTRICYIDYANQMALAVERKDPATGDTSIIGIGRIQGLTASTDSEFSIVVADEYQKSGLGTELLRRLIEIGKAEGVKVITADILAENITMQKVAEKAGFKLTRDVEEPVVSARLQLA